MTAYINLNNNEIPKELLVNKFNMILDKSGRLIPNDHSIFLPKNKPQRPPPPPPWVCSEAATGGVL